MNEFNGFSDLSLVHITDNMSIKAGGVPAVIRQLVANSSFFDATSSLLYAIGDASDLMDQALLFKYQPSGIFKTWQYSPIISSRFRECIDSCNSSHPIVHIHGLWTAPSTISSFLACSSNIPFIFSPHGELEPWLWNGQGILKRLKKIAFWKLLGKLAYSKASLIHAITPLERENLRKLFPLSDIEVIPNSIFIKNQAPPSRNLRKNFLFIGRIDPKKGVDTLIKAFSVAKLDRDWQIDILGPCLSSTYLASLKKLVSSLSLESKVFFHGSVFGPMKQEFLDTSWALAVPSHSEAVGLVNLESADYYLPSLTTYQTGLYDWTSGGGLLSNDSVEEFALLLIQASRWSLEERISRGISSRSLVQRRYTWDVNLPKWQSLYTSLLR